MAKTDCASEGPSGSSSSSAELPEFTPIRAMGGRSTISLFAGGMLDVSEEDLPLRFHAAARALELSVCIA